ncbi:hypothetical protein N7326_06995 [Corynebacterium sp. ES2794-CONJ1]|uniref:hypothetical protein n=1 Tax=unclassified Corynebacterium TaxID=2624378 RepID=UPI002167B026|nr:MULTISPECIES: hypothetical protein [unclassified Corynebacterium]MCS4490076.1 hypothetical protein [Corynebacterium sp. ES2775-CONJ]MCS4532223.1 hypothetical protein [Corynebacterium sp. ES2730-CONJ]MCU9519619.1 hypothetical protein [Corynebacterium sp. ES2794-CONJ1]
MYALLWELLPGPRWFKFFIVLALLIAVFFLLMNVVFPWISSQLPYNDVAV